MSKTRLIKELAQYLAAHKKLFFVPLIVLLGVFGTVALLAQIPALAPLIYALF